MKQRLAILNLVLLVLTVGMAAAFLSALVTTYDLEDTTSEAADDTRGSKVISEAAVKHRAVQGKSDYEVIGARDLFREERRPYFTPTPLPQQPDAPSPVAESTPVPPPKGLKLSAVLKIGRKRVALISESSIDKGEPVSYAVGDKLLDYVVDKIMSDEVLLKKSNGDSIPLELRDYSTFMAAANTAPGGMPVPGGGVPGQNATSLPPSQAPVRRGPVVRRGQQADPNSEPAQFDSGQAPDENTNPFPFLKQALQRAQEEARKRGMEIPEIEEPPPLPDFLKNLGASDGDMDDPDNIFLEE